MTTSTHNQRTGLPWTAVSSAPGVDAVVREVEHLPVLAEDEQIVLWGRYQAGKVAAEKLDRARSTTAITRLRRQRHDGEQALEALLGANFRLALREIGVLVKKRFPGGVPSDHYQEICAEAWVGLTEAITEFDPSLGYSIPNLAMIRVRGHVQAYLDGSGPASWNRVARSASRAESELAIRLGRTPTRDEIQEEVTRYSMQWAENQVEKSGVERDDERFEELSRKKLVRQGTWAAIARIDEVRTRTAAPLSLDAPSGEGDHTLADSLGGDATTGGIEVMAWFLDALDPEDRAIIGQRFALEGGEPATYEQLADEYGGTWVEMRARITSLLGRMRSPVAHFTSLDSGLLDRIERGDTATVAGRLRARRRAAAPVGAGAGR